MSRRIPLTAGALVAILIGLLVALGAFRSPAPAVSRAPSAVIGTTTPAFAVVVAPAASRPGSEASVCGKVVAYAPAATELVLTLEWQGVDQMVFSGKYHLLGPGTVPSDLGAQFAAGRPQTLFLRGWFAPASPSTLRDANVTDYVAMRLTEPCPVTR